MSSATLDTRKLAAARLWAASRMPYLASALFASAVDVDSDLGTIAVDQGWRLHVDPSVMDALDVEQLGRLLVHLAGHLIRDHAGRAQRRGVAEENHRGRWNRCADAEINDDLARDGCVPDVARDVPGDLGCTEGKLAERYYDDAADGPRRWDCGSGCDGCPRSGDGGHINRWHAELLRIKVADEINRYNSQVPGTIPGGWLRWAEQMRPSRLDWRRILAAEVRSAVAATSGCVDYTYRRPSRREHVLADIILPSLYRPVPNVAVVCDVSGSMHERLLGRALAEIDAVLTRAGLRQGEVRVLAVDTVVHAVRRARRAADVQLIGGGGTDMGAGIADASNLRPRPPVVIVLTDGFTPWPDRPPRGVRVIVGVLTQGRHVAGWQPPGWARTIEIGDSDAA